MKELILLQDLGMLYPKENSKHKKRYGLYKCFCGNEFKAQIQDILNNHTNSCGCLHIERQRLSSHRLYSIWKNMISRCTNKKGIYYNYYGRKGIVICDEWLNDFMSFYNWSINNGYSNNLTIDRIDSNKNYESSNCRWVTKTIQSRNTRKLNKINTSGYRGVNLHKKSNKWRARITVNNKEISLGYFDTALDGAKAYDKYVIDNNLEHTRNFS